MMSNETLGGPNCPLPSYADDDKAVYRLASIFGYLKPDKDRDITFDQAIRRIWMLSLIDVFDAEHATLWARAGNKYAMAYSTLPDRLVTQLLARRADPGESRTGLCFQEKRPKYYPTLDSLPACVFKDVLLNETFQATWCLPIPVENLSSGDTLPCVVTIDGIPGKMLSRLSDEFLNQISTFSGQGIAHFLWAEQDTLYRQLRYSIDCLSESQFNAVDDLANRIRKALCFDACTILVADEQSQTLLLAGTTGVTSSCGHGTSLCEYVDGMTGRSMLEMKVLASEPDSVREKHVNGPESDWNDTVVNPDIQELLVSPILSTSKDRMGVVRLRNKKPVQPSRISLPVNVLDQQRIEKVSDVIAPLLKFIQEFRQKESIVRSIRHDVEIPAVMIKGVMSLYRELYQRSPADFAKAIDWQFERRLGDCESVCDILIRMGEMARLSSDGRVDLRVGDKPVDIFQKAIRPLCKMLEHAAKKRGLRGIYYDEKSFIQFDQPDAIEAGSLPALWVDQALVTIATYNLIHNAIKYSLTGTSVEIRATYDVTTKSCIISVSNYGLEIPAKQAERIFEPFFRCTEAKKKVISGMGLGLTYARAIARRHGGDVRLITQCPTTFGLILPMTLARERPL